jgi:phage gpG-like protein
MDSNINVPDFLGMAEQLIADTRRFAKVYCLQWFDDSFQNQGFTDAAFTAWPKRKNDKDPGRAVMIDTTFLRKSLDVLNETDTQIEFGTHVPYAGLHNNGERQRAIQYVRAHHRTVKGKRQQVKPHARKRDVKYPQRKFIGESHLMLQGLDNWVHTEIIKRFNSI